MFVFSVTENSSGKTIIETVLPITEKPRANDLTSVGGIHNVVKLITPVYVSIKTQSVLNSVSDNSPIASE